MTGDENGDHKEKERESYTGSKLLCVALATLNFSGKECPLETLQSFEDTFQSYLLESNRSHSIILLPHDEND